ncbi:ferritin-like domain-containing protein [Propioniciclava tarda]|uniref:DUF2202 domain-containing protein n=1 Tax=Propioniciclava tarda TaxID=433330 RepID=A0A4Q9KP95_PROTD|nr:DUF2202 domain-containing protein [Propioniciclava tarda]TBT96413.1 DUF2202 domain-containing protein [Propioniciclava tarda]SMO37657.1 hypothetical protein SAMN06266982_101366 [Propioniciclava tarda]
MNTTTKSAIVLGVIGSLAGTVALASQAFAAPDWAGQGAQRTPAASTTPAVASAQLAKDLSWMRDEERLARDVYAALAAQYDQALPFASIVTSEQQHFDAVGTLLARYGVADPASGKAAGTYSEPELQALYDKLMAQGKTSLADAYDVGIAIEKADIADLEKVIAETSEADVKRVLGNLLRASEQHLKAFEAAKAGTPLGAHDGTGMQAGRRGQDAGTGAADGTGRGMGRGAGQAGVGQGMGPGQGMGNRAGDGTGTCSNG